ncbi:MAG: 30S ribosomal protein S12 methylthiotransferase RimO [Nitrospinae bacterium]|jgi:ribosomal protein S12 methylthiotransferase|nr:30S ribosomal protein S12 methylthiotransferase RimO [Nitrospinota bacterium]MDA1108903.1 30S ribosomal protein S12 methylthiotransferase RimO [Nitrospinota bacterium]
MKKIGIVSLGCPKNAVDTEYLLGDLTNNGYEITPDQEAADVLVVNTCGFIESAKRESIDAILAMARLKTDGKCQKLIVTGCLAERYSEELLKEIPEIDHMMGVNEYPRLKTLLNGDASQNGAMERNQMNGPAEYFEPYANRILTTPFYSAYLKIAEGCSNKCAFCIIPKMRGNIRSQPLVSLLTEAGQLADRGVKELNLISQDTTMYGFDLRMKDGLIRLLKSLAKIQGIEWIRLFYCYPTFINSDLIEFIAAEEKVVPYIDVPLQHTHDEMLARMKRQERESKVRAMLDEIRNKIPGVALRTTFITGFPGETEAHFRHMLDFVQEMEFDHVGAFTYSHEEGTTAYDYPDDVPAKVKEERKAELMSVQRAISLRRNQSRVGEVHPVLVEGLDAEEGYLMTGRLPTQAPEIDGQVIIEASDVEPGQIVPMRILSATDYDVVATRVD